MTVGTGPGNPEPPNGAMDNETNEDDDKMNNDNGDNPSGIAAVSDDDEDEEQPQEEAEDPQPKAYEWEDGAVPPESLRLWSEVGAGLDKSQTVVWKAAVDSLNEANKYFTQSHEARSFVETYMMAIISILVEQQPAKIGNHERQCVQESLYLAMTLVSRDLAIQLDRGGPCTLLTVLACIFNKKRTFYKGTKGNWNVSHLSGLPEVRMIMINKFKKQGGFNHLAEYLITKVGTSDFPTLDVLHQVLFSLADALLNTSRSVAMQNQNNWPTAVPANNAANNPNAGQSSSHDPITVKEWEDQAIRVGEAVMQYIHSCSEDTLKKLATEHLNTIQTDLKRIFDRLISTRRDATYRFYEFWRAFVHKLITSKSLPLRLFGWTEIDALLEASAEHRPPPRSYMVSNAGCTFVNGPYVFGGQTTADGYAQRGVDISYERNIPTDEPDGGKKLTLFRCTMRSQQKWWFLSEADEEQPGTDRDIDYYQHKSKQEEETQPPPRGWATCRNSGIDPPPHLLREGLMVPPGQEFQTLEHQLAKWAIENGIIELVLGDSVHREIVARSTALMKFLASMCDRDSHIPPDPNSPVQPNQFCLQTSHLLLAWKTCTKKADAAVATQVYQLLVTILPACPIDKAVPLLQAIKTSLNDPEHDNLNEVAEFCAALAASASEANGNNPKASSTYFQPETRTQILELFWAVFIHPEAHSLKTYDSLKEFVTAELGVEPAGRSHRERYLKSCIESLEQSIAAAPAPASATAETQIFRMIKLMHFVLEACPADHAAQLVEADNGTLAILLFRELAAVLARRKQKLGAAGVAAQKLSADVSDSDRQQVSERLRILRNVYGLSGKIFMSSEQLQELWQNCSSPNDYEEVMIFVANASRPTRTPLAGTFAGAAPSTAAASATSGASAPSSAVSNGTGPAAQGSSGQPSNSNANACYPAFTDEVCNFAFLQLFCSPAMNFDSLETSAYTSFQFMFQKIQSAGGGVVDADRISNDAIDAMWRICLRARSDAVAAQAMNDLLAVYTNRKSVILSNGGGGLPGKVEAELSAVVADAMQTEGMVKEETSFAKRVFGCLDDVRKSLSANDANAELAAERCLRILIAAIGQNAPGDSSRSLSTVHRLSSLPQPTTLDVATSYLPHGMRGQSQYRKINVTYRRPPAHAQTQQQQQQQHGQQSQQAPFEATTQNRMQTTKLILDVHPLETMASIKQKIAARSGCSVSAVRPVQVNGRVARPAAKAAGAESTSNGNLSPQRNAAIVDEVGIVDGCELVVVITERPNPQAAAAAAAMPSQPTSLRKAPNQNLGDLFVEEGGDFADRLFQALLDVLAALPWRDPDAMTDAARPSVDVHALVWDLLLAMPTNTIVASRVRVTASGGDLSADGVDAMEVDSKQDRWAKLLDLNKFHRSVYVLLAIDAFLQPAPEVFSCLPEEQKAALETEMTATSARFCQGFIESGGFDAVVRFFSDAGGRHQGKTRMGNAVALRILKCCLFGEPTPRQPRSPPRSNVLGDVGTRLLQSLVNASGLLQSLASMVVCDPGISTATITDVLKFLELLFRSHDTAQAFVALPDSTAEKFLTTLLLWEGSDGSPRSVASINAAQKVRKSAHDLVLLTPQLSSHALPWLIRALGSVQVDADSTMEYFDVLKQLVSAERSSQRPPSVNELTSLSTVVCKKLTSCQRPTKESTLIDHPTGVLSGCLALLRALIESGGGNVLQDGTSILLSELKTDKWSQLLVPEGLHPRPENIVLIDLMGVVFDGFLSPGGSTSVVAICCDKESRQHGFDVVGAAARSCGNSDGYTALVGRINNLVQSAAPYLRHRWGQFGSEAAGRQNRNSSKYSGLRNQGCTCYMNSVLQQLFMMPELRTSMCAAPLPATLRSAGGAVSAEGAALVGKKLAMQWDNGVSYDAMVEAFDERTGMHTIRYCPIHVATVTGNSHTQVQADDVARLPIGLPDELFLSEGRPGKETGVFTVVKTSVDTSPGAEQPMSGSKSMQVEESEDELNSRHLLEEMQRTFIHLDEGSRGRCFDPRALVEACACLKLEFDVWQQNDASEFATKLLDRLETSLKRWAPDHFRYLDHTFGLKQTKQKICKECGLKTNRKEKLLSVDCQIRGKADIHEALASMTEVEIMDGNNQVFCDRCKKNTDTVLKTAISSLPNMLILSLKRFDLDYNTFETVKLNSRCAFGQTLNLKRYTLEAMEAAEATQQAADQDADASADSGDDAEPMDTGGASTSTSTAPLIPAAAAQQLVDEDYEYNLAGVLVHAGVAQGGHYYSFIKDRNEETQGKWFRFDDEDVTPFDPAAIEAECFGGKLKKETKWPNGQVQTVESEQYANALMLFYEKVKKTEVPPEDEDDESDEETNDGEKDEEDEEAKKKALEEKKKKAEENKPPPIPKDLTMSSGFDVFEPDVRRSNTTHRWQTLLFDNEFQMFLKGLLGLCRMKSKDDVMMAVSPDSSPVQEPSSQSWRSTVVDMLLSFVFDVLLYSTERVALTEWVRMLNETLRRDPLCAANFIRQVAGRTRTVSANWLRTYLLDCPDSNARDAAVDLFTGALDAAFDDPTRVQSLRDWTQAWTQQITEIGIPKTAVPCQLEGRFQVHEDLRLEATGKSSSIGVILSHLNTLLEALPRTWRQCIDISKLIRNLSMIKSADGMFGMTSALIAAQIPARLICFVARDKVPDSLKVAFPGSSVSVEVAESQTRAEHNPTAHLMPLGGAGQVMNNSDMNYRGGTSPADNLYVFEALCCLLGAPGAIQAAVVEELPRGRQRHNLTDAAKKALAEIFNEFCAPGAPGMGHKEIEEYLQRCGMDSAAIPPQKINDIMSRYPIEADDESQISSYLSLEGFYAYYRDATATSDERLRCDLNSFGFRPDLSRRQRDTYIVENNNHVRWRNTNESVARDMAVHFKDGAPSLGQLADAGLSCFQLYGIASMSDIMCELLLAAVVHDRNCEMLIMNTLRSLFNAPSGWGGNEVLNTSLLVLRALVSSSDDKQTERIELIMTCTERGSQHLDSGIGLLLAVRAFFEARSDQHYSNEYHHGYDRYVSVLKELMLNEASSIWLESNRDQWKWMSSDLLDHYTQPHSPNHAHRGGDYGRREAESDAVLDGDRHLEPQHQHQHQQHQHPNHPSDSDVHPMNDSEEEDDEDSQFDEPPAFLIVEDAGTEEINGRYAQDGYFEKIQKYSRHGQYQGSPVVFSVFRCNVSNNTRHWYISIVPKSGLPGTSGDIDFYSAPATDHCLNYPPQSGWTRANVGIEPTPTIVYVDHDATDGTV